MTDFTNQEKLTEAAKKSYKSDPDSFYGVPVFPASRSCTGSQPIPYIYDDRVSHDDVVKGLIKLYEMGREARKQLGTKGSNWAREVFNLDRMILSWDNALSEEILKFNVRKGNSGLRVIGI